MSLFKSFIKLVVGFTCIVFYLSGCAKAPDAKLEAARKAVKAAQEAEADKYMVNNFNKVQKALEKAEEEIARQKKSFFLTRKYKRVTEMLENTIRFANDLSNEAPKIKSEMTNQVKENLGLVKGMLAATANDIKRYSRKTDKRIIEELKADLAMADSAAARAAANFNNGDILSASKDLSEVQRLIKKITDTLKPKEEQ